jgi:integrase
LFHVSGFSKAKKRFDRFMHGELRKRNARATLPNWTLHDIRRTVRTRLSELRVPEHVAEAVIGHGRKGITRTYDHHQYLDEKREALDKWSERLSGIVSDTKAKSV